MATRLPSDHILYTEAELRKLHKSVGHTSAEHLRRARPDESGVHDKLQDTFKECMSCSKTSQRPQRFKLSNGTEEYPFDHILAVDILNVAVHNILHCVDESTHFGTPAILSNMKSETVWEALLRCWSLACIGPPDFLRVDQGSNFISLEFKASALAGGITVNEVPVEAPENMSLVERYHGQIRGAYLNTKDCVRPA